MFQKSVKEVSLRKGMVMDKKNVLVLFGGSSPEHEVSKVSADTVIKYLSEEKYLIIPVYITQEGKWLLYDGTIDHIKNISWEKFGTPAVLSPDRVNRGLLRIVGDKVKTIPVDVVFPVLHGENGEDGTIQGLCALAGIPCVGCGVLASAVAMDKAFMKIIAGYVGLPQAKYLLVHRNEFGWSGHDSGNGPESEVSLDRKKDSGESSDESFDESSNESSGESSGEKSGKDSAERSDERSEKKPEKKTDNMKEIAKKIRYQIGYPCFIKPATGGSSIGITKATSKKEVVEALKIAAAFSEKIIIEREIKGREIECGLLGEWSDIKVSVPGEVIPAAEFYDYEAKYHNSESETIVPAHIEPEIVDTIQQMAADIFKAVDGSGLARVDFFLMDDGKVIFNEINTVPGFTGISMFAMVWEASGVPLTELLDIIIEVACKNG